MPTSVFCLASTDVQASQIVESLKMAGFRLNDISILFPDKRGSRDFALKEGAKASEGAAAGVATGGVVGGALGWIIGIGAMAIPGVGPFIAAGPVMAALSGVAIGAAIGGLSGTLIGLGLPEYEAKRYEGMIREGRILISVNADNGIWAGKARKIFEGAGSEDIGPSSEYTTAAKSPVRKSSAKSKVTAV